MNLPDFTIFQLFQVSNWFANARRRLKNVVQENHCSWSKRLRLYNQFVQGNAELLSISSNDSIWNSDEEEDHQNSKRKSNNLSTDDLILGIQCSTKVSDQLLHTYVVALFLFPKKGK